MATLTITIADEHFDRVVAAVCASSQIMFMQGGAPTDDPAVEAAQEKLGSWVVQCVTAYETQVHMQSFVPNTEGIVL